MAPRRLTLWQRNLIGAMVAAVALAVLVVVSLWPQWSTYRATFDPEHIVAPRQSLTVNGQTWTVGQVQHFGRDPAPGAPPLPEATVLTVVTVDRSGPVSPDTYCIGVLTDGQRRWRGTGDVCTRPDRLKWSFVIPADAVPTAVDVTLGDGSILIRLAL